MDGGIWLGALLAVAAFGATLLWIMARRGRAESQTQSDLAAAVTGLATAQQNVFGRMNELSGAIAQIASEQSARHGELARALNERLDAVGKRVGDSLIDQGSKTAESLSQLQQRLGIIDAAQKNIEELSGQVVSLQDILSNKQARGAFGQAQMEHIIADTLPAGTYAFNAPLSNGTRPDCKILLPRSSAAIIIDAKFPRESFDALAEAQSPETRRAAEARVRAEVRKHIDDIAQKYLIPGETQDPAIMFVPAESIYCAVFAEFYDIIQHAQRKRVVIVSPNMLMLAVNTMRALMRDQKMREQAHVIQEEVRKLMDDVRLLSNRTESLRKHFTQAEEDVRKIEISADKIAKRGERVESVDLEVEEAAPEIAAEPPPQAELPYRAAQ